MTKTTTKNPTANPATISDEIDRFLEENKKNPLAPATTDEQLTVANQRFWQAVYYAFIEAGWTPAMMHRRARLFRSNETPSDADLHEYVTSRLDTPRESGMIAALVAFGIVPKGIERLPLTDTELRHRVKAVKRRRNTVKGALKD
jgi:hypothetical protein